MSNNQENPVEPISDDLDTFSAEFFGQNKAQQPEQASPEEDQVEEQESDATELEENDTHNDEADTLDNEDDTEEAEQEEDQDAEVDETPTEPEPKPNRKNRAQERIEELNKKFRETERKLNEALAKLEQNTTKPEPTQPEASQEEIGPQPTDTNEDGKEKYPLGEFDPAYIADLTRFTLKQERSKMLQEEEEIRSRKEQESQKAALQADWNEKLGPAQERYPDFMEKGNELIESFEGLDPAYGEYLAGTLMSMEFGTDVLYYLANNPDEANRIVGLGATKATIALGRIESKFAEAEQEKQKARPKISKAPPPPTHLNKGSAVSKAETPDDTDDLDAFASKFFDKRRRR